MKKLALALAFFLTGLLPARSGAARAQEALSRGAEHEVEPNQEGPPSAVSTEPVRIHRDATSIGPSPAVFSRFTGAADGGSEVRPYPPDPHGAVGPAGIVQVANEKIIYFRRDGTPLLMKEFGVFLPGGTQIQDPQVQYDSGTGRFFLTGIETHRLGCSSDCYINLRMAGSKTSDPASLDGNSWYFYTLSATDTAGTVVYGADYPQSGFDATTFYVSCNLFTLPFDGTSHFLKARIYAFDKNQLAAGTLVSKSIDVPDAGAFSLQPAVVLGGTPPAGVEYLSEIYRGSTTQVRLWALSDALGTPILTSSLITVPNHGGPTTNAPQCGGTGITIYPFDGRAHGNSFWLNGELWLCNGGGYSMGRGIVFYYRLATNGFPGGTPALTEAGGFDGGTGVWNYMPAIGGTPAGDVAMVFTQSSAGQCPTVMASARKAGDTGFPAPVSVAVSPSYYNGIGTLDQTGVGARWGDYAIVSPDPVDGTLWVSHEVANGTSLQDMWSTVWGDLQIPPRSEGWPNDGLAVRTSLTAVRGPRVVPDGSGGTFVAWADKRLALSTGWQVYVQHLTPAGGVAGGWVFGGVSVGTLKNETAGNFAVAADGAGGLFVAWTDLTTTRVQRLTSAGAVATGWAAAGLVIANASVGQMQAVGDGSGGVLVAWVAAGAIRVQRVNGAASASWTPGGVQVGSSGSAPRIVADGAGGAIVAWSPAVRVQHVGSSGTPQWAAGGIAFAAGANSVRLAPDDAGGAYVGFRLPEAGGGGTQDVFLLRVAAGGSVAPGWPASGAMLTPTGLHPQDLDLAADGAGGALCAWADDRDIATSGLDIRAARITGSGTTATGWPATGIAVCSAPGDQFATTLAPAGAGGAAIAWCDARGSSQDIFVQVLTANGERCGTCAADGAALCAAEGAQGSPSIAFAGTGECVAAWEDARANPDCDLSFACAYAVDAQHLSYDITTAVTDLDSRPGALELSVDSANPTSGRVRVRYGVPAASADQALECALFDVSGRKLALLASGNATPGYHVLEIDPASVAGRLRAGHYYVRLQVGWERRSTRVTFLR